MSILYLFSISLFTYLLGIFNANLLKKVRGKRRKDCGLEYVQIGVCYLALAGSVIASGYIGLNILLWGW